MTCRLILIRMTRMDNKRHNNLRKIQEHAGVMAKFDRKIVVAHVHRVAECGRRNALVAYDHDTQTADTVRTVR